LQAEALFRAARGELATPRSVIAAGTFALKKPTRRWSVSEKRLNYLLLSRSSHVASQLVIKSIIHCLFMLQKPDPIYTVGKATVYD
jgi:hypothetical protein